MTHVCRCCGGDGLIGEVMNGNIKGQQRPLAIVPTGTDNALCASLGIVNVIMGVLVAIKVEILIRRKKYRVQICDHITEMQ